MVRLCCLEWYQIEWVSVACTGCWVQGVTFEVIGIFLPSLARIICHVLHTGLVSDRVWDRFCRIVTFQRRQQVVLAIAAATTSIPEGGSRLRARLHRKHLATVQLSILSPAWPAMAASELLVLQAARCHRLLEGCSAAFHLQLARPPWLLVLLPVRLWSRGSLPTAGCCRGCPRGGGGCEYVTRAPALKDTGWGEINPDLMVFPRATPSSRTWRAPSGISVPLGISNTINSSTKKSISSWIRQSAADSSHPPDYLWIGRSKKKLR